MEPTRGHEVRSEEEIEAGGGVPNGTPTATAGTSVQPISEFENQDRRTGRSPLGCCIGNRACSWCRFDGVKMAQGFAINNAARGAVVMSNIFLTASFLYLAHEEVGCVEGDEITDDCREEVYGWKPEALIANIPVISGILSALLMPLLGALMDYTDHRWNVGVATAVLMTLIQGVQIYTVSETWFPMVILQAIAGFLYEIEVLSTYAYLPDIARDVGAPAMTKCE